MNNVKHIEHVNHTDDNNHINHTDDSNHIDHVNHNKHNDYLERLNNSFICRLNELCNGTSSTPENYFESWCVRRLYPALALSDDLVIRPDKLLYEKRISELCAGKAENEFDAWLRERVYPIVDLLW